MSSPDPNDRSVVSVVEHVPRVTNGPRRPGDGRPGPGRPKGVPNRSTETTKFLIQQIVDANMPNVMQALEDVRNGVTTVDGIVLVKPDPGRYMDLTLRLLEFNTPKLQRSEVIVTPDVPEVEDIDEGASADQASEIYLRAVKG